MTRQEIEAIFLLAGYEIVGLKMIPNGYSTTREDSWWEVDTEHGSFTIGWRKRVVSIDWAKIGPQPPITENKNVTQDSTSIHAWSMGDAVNNLYVLRSRHLDRIMKLPKPLPEGVVETAKALFDNSTDESVRIVTGAFDFRPRWEDLYETDRAVYYHRALP